MKIIYLIIAFLVVQNISQSKEQSDYVQDELILKFIPETANNSAFTNLETEITVLDSLNKLYNVTSITQLGKSMLKNTYIFRFEQKQDIYLLIEMYMKTGLFEYVEPNFIGTGGGDTELLETFPNDPLFARQYNFYNDGTFTASKATAGADTDMELAWQIEKGDSNLIVAVLDAGARMTHPEFAGRLWTNNAEVVNGIDDDGNGYIDDVQGWNFAYNTNDPTDDHGHGTNVAGILGANSNNKIGYAGVNWNSKLMILKILNSKNSGNYDWWVDGINYAVDNGAKVLNMSVGGSGASKTLGEAIEYANEKGVVVVACMMNTNNNVSYYPASYESTIAVGSTNPNDERSNPFFWGGGSNFGNHIDVVAPGNYIYGLSYNSDNNFNSYWGGTSQATPLVAGICSLLMSKDPDITPEEIRTILRNTAADQVGKKSEDTPGFDIYYGYGRVNAHKALKYVLSAVKSEANLAKLQVYPNPTTSSLKIDSKLDFQSIRITDLLGQQVFEKSYVEYRLTNEINIKEIPKGVYILSLYGKDNSLVYSEKIIKE